MYLFSRQGRLSGARFREAIGWAAAITNQVTQTTGLPLGLWSQTFSPAVGTLVWATFVPDLGTLEAANDKLMVDDAYNDLAERGQEFTIPGSLDDSLSVVISGEPDPERPIEYVTTVRSTIAAGSLAAGMALGVDRPAGSGHHRAPGAVPRRRDGELRRRRLDRGVRHHRRARGHADGDQHRRILHRADRHQGQGRLHRPARGYEPARLPTYSNLSAGPDRGVCVEPTVGPTLVG